MPVKMDGRVCVRVCVRGSTVQTVWEGEQIGSPHHCPAETRPPAHPGSASSRWRRSSPTAPPSRCWGARGRGPPRTATAAPRRATGGNLALLRAVRADGPSKHAQALREAAGSSGCLPYQVDERGRLRLFHFDPRPHEAAVMAALAEPYGKPGSGSRTLVTRMDPVMRLLAVVWCVCVCLLSLHCMVFAMGGKKRPESNRLLLSSSSVDRSKLCRLLPLSQTHRCAG